MKEKVYSPNFLRIKKQLAISKYYPKWLPFTVRGSFFTVSKIYFAVEDALLDWFMKFAIYNKSTFHILKAAHLFDEINGIR